MEFQEQALHFCKNITALTGISCILIDIAAEKLCCEASPCSCEMGCHTLDLHLSACREARRWSGHYQYHCPNGQMFLAVSLRLSRIHGEYGMVCGPLPPDLSGQQVHALQEIIYAVCGYLAGGKIMSAVDSSIQAEILQTMSLTAHKQNRIRYPLEDERQLQYFIRSSNKRKAQQLLNTLLLELYSTVGTDLLLLKLRIRELITLMSRAAIDGGADINSIQALCDTSILEMERIQDFDVLDAWLGVMLHQFFDMVFDFNDAKHQSTIQQVSAYIQDHLEEKLTLEKVSNQVHLSKSYLCRILKEELGCTFTEYVNRLRVERSKLYLHRSNMSLSEIAHLVGFDDQSYFTRIFKRQVGIPPGKYRTNNANIYTIKG